LTALEQQAHQSVSHQAYVPLEDQSARVFQGLDSFESPASGQVPNYLRALAPLPNTVAPFSHLFKTFVSNSALPSETKLAMALRIAQINNSPYTAAHIERLLRTTERGKIILEALRSEQTSSLTVPEQRAIDYADALTRHVDGLSDAEFQSARAFYNDSQVIELSFTVCFFNYFTRFAGALNLPAEPWVFETSPQPLKTVPPAPARVSLISDEEMAATEMTVNASKNPNSPTAKWGIGIANSQRAMMHAPAMYLAWREFGAAAQSYATVSREIKLQVSFAVSTANGCRYCVLHQVLGLRRLGVDPTKLMAMQKDDSALTPQELAAVTFARKLTASPSGITSTDYRKLDEVFKPQGAMEVLMQTCNFAFMNRFTDGLRLPSEDEAVKVYRETYGRDWQRR
jgi:AhpD family alkylhydroperoxidase